MGPTSKYVPGNQVSRPVDGAGGRGEGDVAEAYLAPWRAITPLAQNCPNQNSPEGLRRSIHRKHVPRASLGEQKPMPLLRFVILKQSTDQRVGVSFVAEDEDELEYGAQRPALHGAAFT